MKSKQMQETFIERIQFGGISTDLPKLFYILKFCYKTFITINNY